MDFQILQELDPYKAQLAHFLHAKYVELAEEEFFSLIEKPPESNMGDYAFPCFRLAKTLRKGPQAIAADLQEYFSGLALGWLKNTAVLGGYFNITLDKSHIASQLLPQIISGNFFKLKTAQEQHHNSRVMVEFSQPNTHKEFHVGHARNVCLGDSLCRLLRYFSYDIVAANYIGDEGTHVAKCLWQAQEQGGLAPAEAHKAHWYGQQYVKATQRLEDASAEQKIDYEKEIAAILTDIEGKRGTNYSAWQQSRLECLADFKAIYAWLDVHFDHYFFESEMSEDSQKIVDEFLKKGLFVISQGAVGVDLEADNLGFFMARKSNGTTPYITKDLVLARRKFEDFKINKSIYIVGNEQILHFKQLFKVLELMGFPQAKECFHLSYAHVRFADGKMSSRKGNVLSFAHLREALLTELQPYLEKYAESWSEESRTKTTDQLAVAAIKYGMLCSDPGTEIVFDLKSWVSFEGNTGPYLLYSYARTQSILNKCGELGYEGKLVHFEKLTHESEWELLRFLYDFNDTARLACEKYKPSILANFLFDMCKSFNRFYLDVSVLKNSDEDERALLISFLQSFSLVLKQGLLLLGITPPERM